MTSSANETFQNLDPAYFVVGEVLSCAKHPDADKLSVTQVFDGESNLQIVCGASNVRQGLKVALSRMGAVLPSGLNIKESKLRGVLSQGMLCSTSEIGLKPVPGIAELPSYLKPGTALKSLQLSEFYGISASDQPLYRVYEITGAALKHPKQAHLQSGETIEEWVRDFLLLPIQQVVAKQIALVYPHPKGNIFLPFG